MDLFDKSCGGSYFGWFAKYLYISNILGGWQNIFISTKCQFSSCSREIAAATPHYPFKGLPYIIFIFIFIHQMSVSLAAFPHYPFKDLPCIAWVTRWPLSLFCTAFTHPILRYRSILRYQPILRYHPILRYCSILRYRPILRYRSILRYQLTILD